METLKLLAEAEPSPPSNYHPKVDSDLQTIAMKCLERDPARRYLSALELADELDRWLGGEPIEARPAGNVERAVKWMKRKPRSLSYFTSLRKMLVIGHERPLR